MNTIKSILKRELFGLRTTTLEYYLKEFSKDLYAPFFRIEVLYKYGSFNEVYLVVYENQNEMDADKLHEDQTDDVKWSCHSFYSDGSVFKNYLDL